MTRNALLAHYRCRWSHKWQDTLPVSPVPAHNWCSRAHAFFEAEPPQVRNDQFIETIIHIACPWLPDEIPMACRLLQILARHCNDLSVYDWLGIWDKKEFAFVSSPRLAMLLELRSRRAEGLAGQSDRDCLGFASGKAEGDLSRGISVHHLRPDPEDRRLRVIRPRT